MGTAYRALAGAVVCLAAAVLTGWAIGAPEITAYRQMTVTVNTGLGLMLCALALVMANTKRPALWDRAGTALAAAAAALGAATLAEYATGLDFGIDQLFVSGAGAGFGSPGRMSALSAFNLVLFALARIAAPRPGRTAGLVFTTALSIGLVFDYLALIGHLYEVSLLSGAASPLAVTPLAAAGYLLLFVGVALVRPDLGWVKLIAADAAGSAIARRMLPVLVLIVPGLGWLRLQGELAGYYDTHAGLALFTITNIILLAATVLLVGRRANQADVRRAARERELADSEERYRTVVDLLQECIYIYDSGKIVYVNQATRDLLGAASEDEIAGRPAGSTLHPDDRPRALAAMRTALETSRPTPPADYRVIAFDGREYITEGRMTSFHSHGGRQVLVVARNVTTERAAEAQLREVQKLEAVGQLTGGIAHDFNNLLAVITSNAEDLEDRLQGDPYRDRAGMVLQAARRGADLVRQLLAYSRKQLLHPSVVDPRAVVESFANLLRRTFPATIDIKVSCPLPTPAVSVDRGMLENAMLNLAVNARDAMPDGGAITIETAVERLTEDYCSGNPGIAPGRYVRISVSDTGEGISPDVLRRVFEPFFTTKEVGKGTGLGLSMVYGFVKQSGGHAKIYSERGVGTVVKLYLPPQDGAAPAPEEAEAQAPARFSGSALLVEDNDLVRATAAAQLRRLGFEVAVATTAAEALEQIARDPRFALVLSDVIMPGALTGADLAREIQRRWPAIKVVLASGYTAAGTLGKVQIPPGVQLLSKPYSILDLSTAVCAALER